MDFMEKIYDMTQTDSIEEDKRKLFNLLKKFEEMVGDGFSFPLDLFVGEAVGYIIQYYESNMEYVNLFYQLLENSQYFMKNEIIDAIFDLGELQDPNRNKEIIKTYLYSSVIQDISFNGKDTFSIFSEQFGNFSFQLASSYFQDCPKIYSYIQTQPMANKCHKHVEVVASSFPDYYAITSLCTYWFTGKYYHSYTLDSDKNLIIDLCCHAVFSREDYYRLYEPSELLIVLNRDIRKELEIVHSKIPYSNGFYPVLYVALYKQYLRNIGYEGSLEDGHCIQLKMESLC